MHQNPARTWVWTTGPVETTKVYLAESFLLLKKLVPFKFLQDAGCFCGFRAHAQHQALCKKKKKKWGQTARTDRCSHLSKTNRSTSMIVDTSWRAYSNHTHTHCAVFCNGNEVHVCDTCGLEQFYAAFLDKLLVTGLHFRVKYGGIRWMDVFVCG